MTAKLCKIFENKTILLIPVFLFLFSSLAFSQSRKVPRFQIIQSDDKIFQANSLPYEKHIIIYYFSPECEECEKVTEELVNRVDDFESASVVFITYFPVETVKEFVTKHSLNGYPNIYVGTEGISMPVANYYGQMDFPFLALYDKNGNFVKKYNRAENLDDLVGTLKKLK